MAHVDGPSLSAHFNGAVHLQLLLSGALRSTDDPSATLIDNLALLHSIAISTAHPPAIAAVAKEARSLVLVSLTDQNGLLFWHLPLESYPKLISGILVPACLSLSKLVPLPHDELAACLGALLSSADLLVDPPIIMPEGLPFATTSTRPFPPFASADKGTGETAGSSGGGARRDGDGGGGEGGGHPPSSGAQQPAAPSGRSSRFSASRWFGGGGRTTTQIGISDVRPASSAASEPSGLSLLEGAASAVGLGVEPNSGSAEERAFSSMAAKLRSLAVQLCKGVSQPIALIIIGLLPSTVRSAAVVSVLMEGALQAYLTAAGMDAASTVGAPLRPEWTHNPADLSFVEEPLAVLGAALASTPDISTAQMVSESMAQQSPLSLRVLLALQLQAVRGESSMVWMPIAVDAVRHAAACRVHPAREFELLPLWFYVVELVADSQWMLQYSAGAEAIHSFSRVVSTAAGTFSASALTLQGSLWDSFGREPPPPLQMPAMQLAARALLLFLSHTLDAKARDALPAGGPAGGSAGEPAVDFSRAVGNAELRTQAGTLMRCAQQPPYNAGYEEFFCALQTLCNHSGPTSLCVYKKEIVRTLLPMAPYLAGL
uniref:Uncharacterized protein n=1 Tax=Haptolina brevifila TaxID=156173 RepID=A0A7S2CKC4_9EUKA